jgi:hypothetical protein
MTSIKFHPIYTGELEIKDTAALSTSASYMDISLRIDANKLTNQS